MIIIPNIIIRPLRWQACCFIFNIKPRCLIRLHLLQRLRMNVPVSPRHYTLHGVYRDSWTDVFCPII
jgi:hypothetical protein